MRYKRKNITLISHEVLINGKEHERPYWGVTNWGSNRRHRALTGLGGEKVGGISLVFSWCRLISWATQGNVVVVGQTIGSISSKTLAYAVCQRFAVCMAVCSNTVWPFVHTWIVHGIDDCYQLTSTFGGFSAQCLSKLFLKEFTILLVTTSFGKAFLVGVILIG